MDHYKVTDYVKAEVSFCRETSKALESWLHIVQHCALWTIGARVGQMRSRNCSIVMNKWRNEGEVARLVKLLYWK